MAPKRKSVVSPTATEKTKSKLRKQTSKTSVPTGTSEEKGGTPMDVTHAPLISEPLKLIILEIYRKNDQPFDQVLCREDCKTIWKELGREIAELKKIDIERHSGRCLQILFKLKKATPITEISKRAEFEVEKSSKTGTDIYSVRLPDYNQVECKLGEIVTVVAFKTIRVETSDIGDWLELYGNIQGSFR